MTRTGVFFVKFAMKAVMPRNHFASKWSDLVYAYAVFFCVSKFVGLAKNLWAMEVKLSSVCLLDNDCVNSHHPTTSV